METKNSNAPFNSGKFLTGDTLTKFWARVGISGENDCWKWDRPNHKFGYGNMYVYGKSELSHRIAYRDCNGPIAEGLVVRHKCDNPQCCNPNHLELGTQKDNLADATERGRLDRGKHHRDKWLRMQAESKARRLDGSQQPKQDSRDGGTMDIEGLKKRLMEEADWMAAEGQGRRMRLLSEAADAIEQLQRELDQRLIALSQLNRELEEARNDAERLNWLLANATEIFFSDDAGGHYHSYKYDEEDAAKFKLAIDAARKKQG